MKKKGQGRRKVRRCRWGVEEEEEEKEGGASLRKETT